MRGLATAAQVISPVHLDRRRTMESLEDRRMYGSIRFKREYGSIRFERKPERFRVDVRPERERVMVVPRGELDLATVDQLAAEVDDLVGRGFDTVVLDLRATSFMDSSGVQLLLQQTARPDAHVTLVDGSDQVRRVIDLAGVRDLLPFEAAPEPSR